MSMPLIEPPARRDAPLEGPYTVEDFYRLVPDGTKADLIDGYIYVASPDTLDNDQIAGFLGRLLALYCEETDAGLVFGSRFAYRLTPKRCPEPDVSFVSAARLSIIERTGGTAAPDVAVEVVSDDSRTRDYVEKFQLYQDAGVREYWIIDPLRREARFHRLVESRFEIVPCEDGVFRSEAVPGFRLRTEWLFQLPLPKSGRCLREILEAAAS